MIKRLSSVKTLGMIDSSNHGHVSVIHNIAAKYRIQSPAYGFTLPNDNVFKATTPPSHVYPKGTVRSSRVSRARYT